jgi:glycosyltransferase involved in cell wall biosynthesis
LNVLFLSLSTAVSNLNNRGIYPDLLRKFANSGHNVYIVCPAERRQKLKTSIFRNGNINILKVWTLNITKTNFIEKLLSTVLISFFYGIAIRKYFKNDKFDLILYSTPPITFNKLIKRIKKDSMTYLLLKDIFPQNAIDLNLFTKKNPLYWSFRFKEKKLYEISDHIGCMSPANVEYLKKNNPEIPLRKFEVCPNSIEISKESRVVTKVELLNRFKIPQNSVVFTFGGNLGRPQGIDFLIEVLKSNISNRSVYFIISGNGTDYPKIKNWIDKSKPTNVLLINGLPKDEYDDLLSICDVGMIFLNKDFTIPNYPSRLLTYMERKLPIIMATDSATDIGIISEINNYGLWVKSGDLKEFNTKLEMISNNKDLRIKMGENGYQYLLKEYTVDKTYEIIMNHF